MTVPVRTIRMIDTITMITDMITTRMDMITGTTGVITGKGTITGIINRREYREDDRRYYQ